MAIYTPRQTPSRSRKSGGKSGKGGGLLSWGRRSSTAPKPSAPRTSVAGVQRTWRWRQRFRGLLLIVVPLMVLAGGLWAGSQLLFRSTIFHLTDIRVQGNHVATQRQILELAGLQMGDSLFRFDTKAAVARIQKHPWVEKAEILTNWPSSVVITVTERQPFALVNIEDAKERRLRYLDSGKRLFAEVGQGQELDYPVITGVRLATDVAGDRLVPGSLAEAACNLLTLADQGNPVLPVQAISEVHIDPEQGLILYLVERPFPIYFGKDRLRTNYYRLIKVLGQLYAKKQFDAVKDIRMDYLNDKVLVTGAQID